MTKTITIDYYTEDPSVEYAQKIRATKTKEELIEVLKYYKPIASDALKQAKKMTDKDFKDFKKDLPRAKKELDENWVKTFVERFGVIAIPGMLLEVSLISLQYHVPWGSAFIRLRDIKKQK